MVRSLNVNQNQKISSLSKYRFLKAYWVAYKLIIRYLFVLFIGKFVREDRFQQILEKAHQKTADQIVASLLELKGLYIKIGQTFSVMSNFLPPKFTSGFEKLQDSVPPHPFSEVKERFQKDFGKDPGELFQKIEEIPIASASLGQVHVAYAKTGEKLAVKVQYPNIEEITKRDLKTIKNISSMVHFFFPGYNLKSVFEECSRIILNELNYKLEAQNIIDIQNHFLDQEDYVFPKVWNKLSSEKVLTLSFIEGVKVTNQKVLKKYHVDQTELAKKLIHFYCKQIFVDGLYHADPHPGNILITEKGQIAMIDFGAVATVSLTMKKGLMEFVEGIIKKDSKVMSQALKTMGFIAKQSDEDTLDKVVEYFYSKISAIKIDNFKHLDVSQFQNLDDLVELKKMDISFRELTTLFVVPREWILLERTMLLMSGLTAQLDEKLNPVEIVVPYVEKYLLGGEKNVSELFISAGKEVITSYLNLPQKINRTLKQIHEGKIKMEVKGLNEQITSLRRSFKGLTLAFLTAFTGVMSYLFYQDDMIQVAYRFEMGCYTLGVLTVLMLLRK